MLVVNSGVAELKAVQRHLQGVVMTMVVLTRSHTAESSPPHHQVNFLLILISGISSKSKPE